MTEISEDSSSSSKSYSPTVGERLRLAREAKKITITEVVAQLRLTKENIVYLESDQWDKLHGRPYARGYFANYVNFLGLPYDEMLALFNMEYTSKEPSIDGFKRTENGDSDGIGFGWLKVLLLLAIIGAATWFAYQYWLEMQNQLQQSDITLNSSLSGADNEKTNIDGFNESIIEPLPVLQSESISNLVPEETYIEEKISEKPADEVESILDTEPNNSIESSVASNNNLELMIPEQQNQTVDVVQAIPSAMSEQSDSNVETQTTEQNVLTMQFTDDCWVEIRDRNNNKILHKIALAGETVEITGDWPLQVILGNASAATVRYNNEDFDISTFIRKNVARFSIGEEEATE
jgi:cytoskeleton protein RodZ